MRVQIQIVERKPHRAGRAALFHLQRRSSRPACSASEDPAGRNDHWTPPLSVIFLENLHRRV